MIEPLREYIGPHLEKLIEVWLHIRLEEEEVQRSVVLGNFDS